MLVTVFHSSIIRAIRARSEGKILKREKNGGNNIRASIFSVHKIKLHIKLQ